jgi:D-serine deaminase-like pyridoxal phosphate-dependent protein
MVRRLGHALHLFIDLDPGFHRTGVPLQDRKRIYRIIEAAGLHLTGLHYYDGHLSRGTPQERQLQCAAVYGELLELVDELGRDDLELITSGTPTFSQALEFDGFAGRRHTVSPGTIVYSDVRTEELGVLGFERAAHVLTRVVSSPFPDRVTCDAGSKAVDAAAGDPAVEVEGWPDLRALTPSEEHLPLLVQRLPGPKVGDLLELAPRHVCPTVNLADEAVLLEGERVVGVVPVAARGHETLARPA